MLTAAAKFGKLNLSAGVFPCSTINKHTSSPLPGADRPTGKVHLRTQGTENGGLFCVLGVAISPRQTIDRTAPQKGTEYKNPENRPVPGVNSLHTHIKQGLPSIPERRRGATGPRYGRLQQQSGFSCQDIAKKTRGRFGQNLNPLSANVTGRGYAEVMGVVSSKTKEKDNEV